MLLPGLFVRRDESGSVRVNMKIGSFLHAFIKSDGKIHAIGRKIKVFIV